MQQPVAAATYAPFLQVLFNHRRKPAIAAASRVLVERCTIQVHATSAATWMIMTSAIWMKGSCASTAAFAVSKDLKLKVWATFGHEWSNFNYMLHHG